MKQFQIFSSGDVIKAVDMEKYSSPDVVVNTFERKGYKSMGFIDANSEEQAVGGFKNGGELPEIEPRQKQVEKVEPIMQKVQVIDVNMPFGSMVVFMVKWAFAAIPAGIVLFVAYAMISSILAGLFYRF